MGSHARDKDSGHLLFLDGLRGVAAGLVLIAHWFDGHGVPMFGTSVLAVDFFFLLSGFVVAHAYEARLQARQPNVHFVQMRLIRLYPVILLAIALGFARFAVLSLENTGSALNGDLLVKLAANIVMIPLFGYGKYFPLNGPLWSLHFELVAYLAFWLVLYRMRNAGLWIVIFVCAAGTYLWVQTLLGPGGGPQANESVSGYFYRVARVGFSFPLGMLLRRHLVAIANMKLPHGAWLVLLLAVPLALPRYYYSVFGGFALIALVFPFIIAAGTKVELSPIGARIATVLGNLSYPLYALHEPLIWTMSSLFKRLKLSDADNVAMNGFIILPLTIAASYAAFYFYDQPVRRWLKARLRAKDAARARIDTAAVEGTAG
jgi:peptidoglycan/LPS O-acetylase OafA/YrhL